MEGRATLFVGSANLMLAGAVLAGVGIGFRVLFTTAYSLWEGSPNVTDSMIDAFFAANTPSAVRWTLGSFGLYIALLFAMMRLTHRLDVFTLLGPLMPAWREFWRVSLYLTPLYAIMVLPALAYPQAQQQFSFGPWLALLPTVIPFLFIQISAEELVFRGYLQSHLAAIARHPVFWMGVPSVLFGLIHFDPAAPAYSAWAYVVWATCLGLVCADLTARSGTLGPALAVHFINNFGAIFVLSSDEWLSGAALYVWPTFGAPWDPWIPYEVLALTCVWLTGRLALRR